MDKKYQFFISSTYEDLKQERQTVISAVLAMGQFPVGMEMFSAADEEQWQLITEAIDSSDYYILIIGNHYGSVIENGSDAGISYTEKEFNYAISKNLPILAFIIDKSLEICSIDLMQKEGDKIDKLQEFKEKVKQSGRTVRFWKNADNVATLVSQAINTAIKKNNRPGWIRTTDFNIDKTLGEMTRLTERVRLLEHLNADLRLENNRKPNIVIECAKDFDDDIDRRKQELIVSDDGTVHFHVSHVDMSDVDGEIVYSNELGEKCTTDAWEIKLLRYLCKNGFSLIFFVKNEGNLPATDVRVKMLFPNDLMVISMEELIEHIHPTMGYDREACKAWNKRFFEPGDKNYKHKIKNDKENKFFSIDELIAVDEISEILEPSYYEDGFSIFPSEVRLKFSSVKHYDSESFQGVYILPLSAGEFEIECSIICNEYVDVESQKIKIMVD